jgi:hypothetical protein
MKTFEFKVSIEVKDNKLVSDAGDWYLITLLQDKLHDAAYEFPWVISVVTQEDK